MEEKETIHINLLTELTGNLISEESEWEEEWTENDAYGMPLDGTDLAWYESAIREELNRYGEDDLMQYFDGSESIHGKIQSAVVTVENKDGILYGCTKLELNEFLNPEELKELGDYITGQYSDGWGEGFEQQDIQVEEGILNVHFWHPGMERAKMQEETKTQNETQTEKSHLNKPRPKLRLLGHDGNIFSIMSDASILLKNNDQTAEAKEMCKRVLESGDYVFKFYSDAEIKRLNEHIFKMDEQICRALIIHQLLGTRISDTLTLKTDCLSMRNNRYFIRIDQVKSVTYEKAISEEVAQLIMKAIDYTKERYGETTYIFAKKDDPTRPYQYSMIQNQIMTMIRQEDIRDDNGEFLKFGTHIFRHCYGKKLTEMHVDDWMIAKLLGHTSIYSVHHYRKIGNKLMADETRAAREKMDMILLDIIEGWDDYEI